MTGSLRCETGLQCRQRRRRPPPAHAALACQLRPTHPACLPACLPACRRPDGGLLRLPLRPGNSQLSQGALQGSVVGDSDTRRAHRWRIGRASLLTGSAEPDRTALDEGAARDGIGRSQGGGCPVPGAWCLVPGAWCRERTVLRCAAAVTPARLMAPRPAPARHALKRRAPRARSADPAASGDSTMSSAREGGARLQLKEQWGPGAQHAGSGDASGFATSADR